MLGTVKGYYYPQIIKLNIWFGVLNQINIEADFSH